jgi:hypothetical protein
MRTHENRRYVKLRRIAVAAASALVLPSAAGAQLVSSSHGAAALALRADGTPYVAYVDGCALRVAQRAATGWTTTLASRCLPLAPSRIALAGAVVDARGRVSVLVHDAAGSRILLVRQTSRGFRLQTVARPQHGSVAGSPGLALDARGSPVVAYAVRRRSQATFLRLVRANADGRLTTAAITLRGFPSAAAPPAAAPVLVQGRIHVVEAFATEAIEWIPQGKKWLGQFLFASIRGEGAGPVFAAAAGGATWTAATLLQPEFDESDVLLTQRADTETTSIVLTHALVAALTVAGGQPEVAGNEAVGDETAALVADASGDTAELDGRIVGYAASAGSVRHLLLSTDRGLEWFSSPVRPDVHVELAADASGSLTGQVAGASEGAVELYREAPSARRVLVVSAPIAGDGSFRAQDAPPATPTLYRAVYRDPATGIPYASLTRAPVG